jgi:hypothetical protein
MTDRAIFARLKALLPWQEAVTRYRLSLILGWKRLALSQASRKRYASRMTKRQYCSSRGVAYSTFLKWERNFERMGIEGIILKYGHHRKGKSKYEQEINLINSALLGPARTVKELHAELSGICRAKKIETPPIHALRRILKNADLRDFLVEGHGVKSWIKIDSAQGRIEVDLSRPLACIERAEKRLKSHLDAQVLIQLMRLRLENYVADRGREERHSLTQSKG